MSHQRRDKTPLDIVVIGAGLGGLTVAARLANRGHRVSIYEKSNRVGGKCHTEWIDGFGFDTGPSLLTIPAVYRDFFMKTGRGVDLDLIPLDPAFDYHFADQSRLRLPNLSRNRAVDEISRSFGSEAGREWGNLLDRAALMWQASRNDFVERALPTSAELLRRRKVLSDLITIAPLTTLRRFTKKRVRDQRLRYIIDRYATYTGSDPRKVPAVLLTIAFVEEAFGAWHIRGGLGGLVKKVSDRAFDLGVQVHFNTGVEEIKHDGEKVTGIHLADGQEIAADVVISNADAYLLYNSMLDESVARKERARINRSTPSLSGFSLLLGLRPAERRLLEEHHTVFFPERYDDEFDEIFKLKRPVSDPTIYICSPNDPEMVPKSGGENLFVLVNAARHEPERGFDWSAPGVVEVYGEKIIDLMVKRIGIDFRDRIEVKRFRSPLDIEEDYQSVGGSIYGPSSNGIKAAFRRAPNVSTLDGLYNVGGSAHPGGGLPLVGLSGEIVAEAVSARANR
jgi:phytoene desaturase